MLIDKRIQPYCAYCKYGTALGKGEVVCIKRGIMESFGSCKAFRYEPTKREPERLPVVVVSDYTEEDFKIQ